VPVIWMAVTPIVYRLARSFPFEKGKLPVTISVHLLAGSLISLATLGIYTFVWLKITGMSASLLDIWGMRLVADFHFYLLLYFVLVGLYHVYNYYSRFREQERRTDAARGRGGATRDTTRAGPTRRAKNADPSAFSL
jgi:hypothetical protein